MVSDFEAKANAYSKYQNNYILRDGQLNKEEEEDIVKNDKTTFDNWQVFTRQTTITS